MHRYGRFFNEVIYAPDLSEADIERFDTLLVPDRLHPGLLRMNHGRLLEFLDAGKTLAVLGEVEAHTWLPGLQWTHTPTNFWWWLDSNQSLGLEALTPDHDLFRFIRLEDATWHIHGYFKPPVGAVSIIGVPEQGVLLYEDEVSFPGRLVISTLDPFYHYGSHLCPRRPLF